MRVPSQSTQTGPFFVPAIVKPARGNSNLDLFLRASETPLPNPTITAEESVSHARLFAPRLRQQTYGNCGLIALFHSLSKLTVAPKLLPRFVTEVGSDYDVALPFGTRKKIRVAPKDLKWHFNRAFSLLHLDDSAPILWPVKASRGWQALEAAYGKSFGPSANAALTNGTAFILPHLTRLFGAGNFNYASCDPGNGTLADQSERVELLLNALDLSRHIAVASTNASLSANASPLIYGGHYYSIDRIRKSENGTILSVDVVDPHDTATPIHLSFREFLDTFSQLEAAAIDFGKILPTPS